jgi:hypothetical protein
MSKRKDGKSLEVSPAAHAALVSMSWSGLPYKVMVERMLLWLSEQPGPLQAQILSSVPDSLRLEFAQLCLEQVQLMEDLKRNTSSFGKDQKAAVLAVSPDGDSVVIKRLLPEKKPVSTEDSSRRSTPGEPVPKERTKKSS